MLDRAAVFRKVYRHLLDQGRPAIMPECIYGRCVYRTSDGLKCAIGILIDDADYEPCLNGEPLANPAVIEMLQRSGLDIDLESGDLAFLLKLQAVHDESPSKGGRWREEVETALQAIADQFGLLTDLGIAADLRAQSRPEAQRLLSPEAFADRSAWL